LWTRTRRIRKTLTSLHIIPRSCLQSQRLARQLLICIYSFLVLRGPPLKQHAMNRYASAVDVAHITPRMDQQCKTQYSLLFLKYTESTLGICSHGLR
jgi:hypothetical protein